MWALDSSWLFAFFDREDDHHAQARREASDPRAMLLNPTILIETLDLVRHRADRETSATVARAIAAVPNIRLVANPKLPRLIALMEKRGGMSWHDATAIATALDEGADLRTFDRDQRKAFEALR